MRESASTYLCGEILCVTEPGDVWLWTSLRECVSQRLCDRVTGVGVGRVCSPSDHLPSACWVCEPGCVHVSKQVVESGVLGTPRENERHTGLSMFGCSGTMTAPPLCDL